MAVADRLPVAEPRQLASGHDSRERNLLFRPAGTKCLEQAGMTAEPAFQPCIAW
jgi:hypothetical protein